MSLTTNRLAAPSKTYRHIQQLMRQARTFLVERAITLSVPKTEQERVSLTDDLEFDFMERIHDWAATIERHFGPEVRMCQAFHALVNSGVARPEDAPALDLAGYSIERNLKLIGRGEHPCFKDFGLS